MDRSERISGSLFGLAFGDALGAPAEFMRVDEILQRWPPEGPTVPEGEVFRVTDDTQMALAVGEALLEGQAAGSVDPERLDVLFRKHFVAWWRSPENDRAPGRTCLQACEDLAKGKPWLEASVPGSKGCGANMRVAPIAFAAEKRGPISQLQAALTHGHPTGLAASELTAEAIAGLAAGVAPRELVPLLRGHAEANRHVYHEVLGDLWKRPVCTEATHFIERGWDECLAVLARLEVALRSPDRSRDPCEATGEGWVAEEALATGLLSFLLYPDEPLLALRRAACTGGDSDSIASLTGSFAGAHCGVGAWPTEWFERIEYRPRLERLCEGLAALAPRSA